MAEYLIQGETLDNIANAINAKTGGSSAMTPAEMVTAIGSISGGGSAPDEWHFVGEFEVLQDVHTFQIDTSNYNYNSYLIFANGSFTASDWVHVYINSFRSGYGQKFSVFPSYPATITLIPPLESESYSGTAYPFGWSFTTNSTNISAINSVSIGAYTRSVDISAGTKFRIYGRNA